MKFRVSTCVFQIEEEIRKRHGGSIGDIQMCLQTWSTDMIMHDKMKTLRDHGIAGAYDALLLYDFKPIQAPMLTTKFNYRVKDE